MIIVPIVGIVLLGVMALSPWWLPSRDLGDVRRREYPRRCRYCHLYVCRCTESYEIRPGQKTRSPERVANALWN